MSSRRTVKNNYRSSTAIGFLNKMDKKYIDSVSYSNVFGLWSKYSKDGSKDSNKQGGEITPESKTSINNNTFIPMGRKYD